MKNNQTNSHKRFVFLDDIRIPSSVYLYTHNPIYLDNIWTIVRSYDEFIKDTIDNGLANFYSFDHDLGIEHYGMQEHLDEMDYLAYKEKTGYHCAKWLIEYCMDNNLTPPEYLVHSQNVPGGTNIKYFIENYKRFLKSQK
jgi:hypothetical protein